VKITAVSVVIEPQIQGRGTAPVRLLYIPEDCGCRAPTAWSIYVKIAVNKKTLRFPLHLSALKITNLITDITRRWLYG
jgi:hypothetical protein